MQRLVMLMCSVVLAPVVLAANPPASESDAPSVGEPAWSPIPDSGLIPPVAGMQSFGSPNEMNARARVRQYEKQLRIIHRKYFQKRRAETLRAQGFRELYEFTDPAAFLPIIEVFGDESDAILLPILDHFASLGEHGEAALTYLAISHDRAGIRNEASMRVTQPDAPPVLGVLNVALRDSDHHIVSNAALFAGTHNLLETIPLLIFGQAAASPRDNTGDQAWIAIETQRAYVIGTNPTAGNGAGAFGPVIGTVSEGAVLRIQDSYVISYRTVVHRVLVSMTTADWGQSTADLEYDLNKWLAWYNTEYIPFKLEHARIEALADDPEATGS
ncbi:MAG: hypothetical protein AAF432_12285 [Planctomycetota bacterium]